MSLCRRCGLCCDGTLFAWVAVAPQEVQSLRSLRLPVVQRSDGSPALRQPCPALSGRDCTVYAARPGPCRQFRCHQLIALEEGEIDLGEALGVVERTHQEIRGLARDAAGSEVPGGPRREGQIPDPASEPEVAGVVDAARRQVAAGTASPRVLSALERIEALLARDFLGRARRA